MIIDRKQSIHLLFTVLSCILVLAGCTSKKSEPEAETVDSTRQSARATQKNIKDFTRAAQIASSNTPAFHGRCINVSICGVDARLSEGIRHADANHVIRFWLDSGAVEIIDIPRDTPVDAGLDSNLNILTNLRANRGRRVYLDTIAKISGAPKIDYYCELGFSQAMGMLELLGHKDNAAQTLRVLRSRQGFDAGDFQRCFNQGNFMSQLLTRHFGKATGWFRDPVLRAALLLVDTNIPLDTLKMMVDQLEMKGFPANKKCYVRVKPNLFSKLDVYDFNDASNVEELNKQIDQRLKRVGIPLGVPSQDAFIKALDTLVSKATKEALKSPRVALNSLERVYVQRAWMQVSDRAKRADLSQRICLAMITCYNKIGKKDEALKVAAFYEEQKELLEEK